MDGQFNLYSMRVLGRLVRGAPNLRAEAYGRLGTADNTMGLLDQWSRWQPRASSNLFFLLGWGDLFEREQAVNPWGSCCGAGGLCLIPELCYFMWRKALKDRGGNIELVSERIMTAQIKNPDFRFL